MKSRTTALASSVILLAMTIGVLYAIPNRSVVAAHVSPGGTIEGTWRVLVTQRDCQTGVGSKPFPAMLTFAKGGTLTGTSTILSPALRGPDHGSWSFEGGQNYRVVSEAFIFNPAGAWTATQRLYQEIELNANSDSFNSNATTEFFNTAGVSVATGCATAVGTRMD